MKEFINSEIEIEFIRLATDDIITYSVNTDNPGWGDLEEDEYMWNSP